MGAVMDRAFVQPELVPFPLRDGEPEITVGPADMGRIAALLEAVPQLLQVVLALAPDEAARFEANQATAQDIAKLLLLLSTKGADVLDLVAIAAGLKYADVAAMLPDRFAALFAIVVQVNADFFSAAWPAMVEATRRLVAAARPTGPSSSTS